MLRKDGDYVINQIFCQKAEGKEYPTYGAPENSINNEIINGLIYDNATGKVQGTCQDEYYQFTACGECWQTTGWHGTFDKKAAIRLMTQLALDNPGKKFSVKQTIISQHSETIASIRVD